MNPVDRLGQRVQRQEDLANIAALHAYSGLRKRLRLGLGTYRPERSWLAVYMAQVPSAISEAADQIAASSLRISTKSYRLGYYFSVWRLASMLKPEAPLQIAAPRGPEALLEEDAYDDIVRSLLGRGWREQFSDQLETLVPAIKLDISHGMSAGEGIDDIMKRIERLLGIEGDPGRPQVIGGAYKGSYAKVQAIVRTVVNTASNNGAIEAYRNNADVLDGYKWYTSRWGACPECLALNEQWYPLDSEIRPPRHPNCRCTVVPSLDPYWIPETPPRQRSFAAFLDDQGLGITTTDLGW